MRSSGFEPGTVLQGELVRLRPFRTDDVEAVWNMVRDPVVRRLTGTHAEFSREAVERWCRTRGEQHDRLDLAIATSTDDGFVGEVVLHELDVNNRSCGFRISLAGPSLFGRGFGTEATTLAVRHAFAVGLHRVALEVFAFNHGARRVYEKVGFVVEGVRRDALFWDGEYHDAVMMSRLSTDTVTDPS